jgi:hypothetical protein
MDIASSMNRFIGVLSLALLASCGGGGGDAPAAPPPANASLTVTVIDTLGRFVAGASVSSPSGAGTTDASGKASLPVANGSELAISVAKTGFAEQVKLVTLPASRSADALVVMLIQRDGAVDIASIEAGGSASGRDGVKVTFPAGALVTAAGAAVSGTIQMQMTPVNVVDLDAGAFPGVFEGLPTGATRAAIMSYGTAELLPLQGRQKLNLAAGKTADIELPIYAGLHQSGTAVAIGDTIALWSLNASTGLWTQEGTGSVVANAASPSGKALRATISHFSWWNADVASQMATVNLSVVAPGASPAVPTGTLAAISGQVVAGTGPGWVATTSVLVGGSVSVRIPSNATTRLSARVDLATQVCTGSVDLSPAPGATIDAAISAVCFTVPVPTIVQPANGTVTNSAGTLTVTTTIDGSPPDTLDVLVDGTLDPNQHIAFAQFFYRTPWNLAPLAEGTHTLTARTTRAGVSRDSTSVTVTIDRTPPQEVAISPPPGSDVTPATLYTVDFDESVNPGLFALSDAVKLTVTPLGQSTPQALQATLAYDDTQRRLSVSLAPNQTLPLGVVGLSWGGLQDGAGNAVAGTLAATWNVARTTNVASVGDLFSNSTFVIATNSAGTVFALRRRTSDGNLVMSRLDATGLVQVGPVINDRTPGGNATGSIAADANGVPFVAFVQTNATGAALEIVVKRFDANANAWVTLVAPFAVPNGNPDTVLPKLQLTAAGQPVLVFSNQASLRGFRFDGTAWADLGSFADSFIVEYAVALDSNGNPIVALFEGQLRVIRNTGSAWVVMISSLDGVPDGTQNIFNLSMALDAAGQPWLAWLHFSRTSVLHLVRFDGTNFLNVPIVPAPPSGTPSFTFLNGDPVLALGDDSSNVIRFHNGAWEAPVPVPIDGRGPIVAAPSNGALMIGVTSQNNGTLVKVAFP